MEKSKILLNRKLVIALLLLSVMFIIPSISAVTDNNGAFTSPTQGGPAALTIGQCLKAVNDISINNFYSLNGTNCYIYTGKNCGDVATGWTKSFSGMLVNGICNVNGNVNLSAGESFILAFNTSYSNGNDGRWYYQDTGTSNITRTNVIWTEVSYNLENAKYYPMWINIANITTNGLIVSLISPQENTTILKDSNVNLTCSATSINTIQNLSLWTNITGTWEINQTHTGYISGGITDSFILSAGVDNFIWGCQACDNSNSCAFAGENRTVYPVSFIENSQTFNPTTSSGAIEPFTLNITFDSASYTGISVFLDYNNTNYTASSTGSGNTLLFSKTITVPTVSTLTNKTFYWIIALSNSTGTTYLTTTQYNQTIGTFLVDSCGTYTKKLFNLTMIDEESLVGINGTIEVAMNFYTHGTGNLIGVYNSSFNYKTTIPTQICLNNLTSSYDISYQIRYYGNSSYVKKYKIVQLMTVTNTTTEQDIILYNLLTTSAPCPFKISVTGDSFPTYNSNLLVEVDKQYLAQNQFIPVEDTLTDANGNGILHLVQDSEVYNFIVSHNGQVLGTFNNFNAHCGTALTCSSCVINFNLAQATGTIFNYNNYGNISTSYVIDNATQTLFFTFVSTDGRIHTVNQVVTADDGFANTTICNLTGTGTSGTLICALTGIYQNSNVWSEVYSDGLFIENHPSSFAPITDYFGVDVIIELLMFSCLVMLFLHHPIFIVIGSVLGFIFSIILLFISGGNFNAIVGVVAFYVVGGGLVIWQIARKV